MNEATSIGASLARPFSPAVGACLGRTSWLESTVCPLRVGSGPDQRQHAYQYGAESRQSRPAPASNALAEQRSDPVVVST